MTVNTQFEAAINALVFLDIDADNLQDELQRIDHADAKEARSQVVAFRNNIRTAMGILRSSTGWRGLLHDAELVAYSGRPVELLSESLEQFYNDGIEERGIE